MFNLLKTKFVPGFKFKTISRYIPYNSNVTILDIGAGNHSATCTKNLFKNSKYYGLDIQRDYRNNQSDFDLMEDFYEIDLTTLKFDKIPDKFFDLIIMTHVIEHLHNGDQVIKGLLQKLKEGGIIFIEYPAFRSTKFPSMRETLNFYDDTTHVRLYSLQELYNILSINGLKYIKGGTRRYIPLLLLTPLTIIFQIIKHGFVTGGALWDLLGFSEYLIFKKVTR